MAFDLLKQSNVCLCHSSQPLWGHKLLPVQPTRDISCSVCFILKIFSRGKYSMFHRKKSRIQRSSIFKVSFGHFGNADRRLSWEPVPQTFVCVHTWEQTSRDTRFVKTMHRNIQCTCVLLSDKILSSFPCYRMQIHTDITAVNHTEQVRKQRNFCICSAFRF